MAILDGHFSGVALRKSTPLTSFNSEISFSSFAKSNKQLLDPGKTIIANPR